MPAAKDGDVKRDMLLPQNVRSYIKEHGIDHAITEALNDVIKKRPADPIGHLAGALALKSTSPPRIEAVCLDASAPKAALRFHVVVATRGVHARMHTFSLEGLLLAREPAPGGAAAEPPPTAESTELSVAEDAARLVKRRQEDEMLVAFLESFFRKAFKDASVNDFLTFHERCEGLAQAPPPEGWVVDVPRASAAVADELLVAAARSLNISSLEFLQQLLARAGTADLASPPLRTLEDLAAWRARWPRISMPIFHGGGPSPVKPPSLRVCTALSPLAGGASQGDVPSPGWLTAAVQALRELAATAARDLQKEKASAALAVDGVAHCVGGLERTLELAQKSAETFAGSGRLAETCGVLWAAAEEAWVEDEGVYEFEAGKKLALEQLVDLYDGLAKTGWLRMVVQPFRQADALAGCDLLHARRPELKLVVDFGDAEPPPAPKGAAYSCGLAIKGSAPLWLRRYAALAPAWREAGGCGRCLRLDAATAAAMPSALELVLTCAEAEVLCLPRTVTDADVARMSARADDVLYGAMFPDDAGGAEA